MSDSLTTGERLTARRSQIGRSLEMVARAAGYKGASSIQRYFSPEYDEPLHPNVADKLRRGLEGSLFPVYSDDEAGPPTSSALGVEVIPTYAGMGGGGTGDGDVTMIAFPRELIERDLRGRAQDFAVVIALGDSMEPDFKSGDQLLVDRRLTSIAQPGAFCLWDGDGIVVKLVERIPRSDPPRIRIFSANGRYREAEALVDEVRIIGRVVWFGRRV